MRQPRERRGFLLLCLGVVVATSLPLLYAGMKSGPEYVFAGFLFNPLDNQTYLAKMYQGWQGDWRFHLPYTAASEEGAYLNLYYLFLGHVSRWLGIPLVVVFHLARLGGGIFLLVMLERFFRVGLKFSHSRRLAMALAAFGAGLGWIAAPFGLFTSDFWVAEAYPFLAIYTNPHFPLGIGLLLYLITPSSRKSHLWWKMVLATIALGVILPFGVVLAASIWTIWTFGWLTKPRRRQAFFNRVPIMIFCGGIPLLYALWVTYSDPVFAGWSAQNITPTPPWWDLLLAFSPVLPLAVVGVWRVRRPRSPSFIMVVWLAVGLILLTIPWSLQRRFMTGLYIPLSGLAALGVLRLAAGSPRRYRMLVFLVFLLAIPTTVSVVWAGVYGVRTTSPMIYLTRDEVAALRWLESHTAEDALVLTSPEMGLFIPAFTGRRVIYGHPFETVNAAAEKERVEAFFSATMDDEEAQAFLNNREVQYIFFGPREEMTGEFRWLSGMRLVFQSGDVRVYAWGNGSEE